MTTDVLALIDFYVDNGIIEKAEGAEGAEVYPVTVKQLGTDEKVSTHACKVTSRYSL